MLGIRPISSTCDLTSILCWATSRMQAIAKTSVPTCKSFCPVHLGCRRGTFCFMCVYQGGRWGFSSYLFCCISASYCSVLKINANYITMSRLMQLPILCYITNPGLVHSAQICSLIVPPRRSFPSTERGLWMALLFCLPLAKFLPFVTVDF